MKIKKETRKLVAGCSKHRFEVVDKADVVCRDFRRVLESSTEVTLGKIYPDRGAFF